MLLRKAAGVAPTRKAQAIQARKPLSMDRNRLSASPRLESAAKIRRTERGQRMTAITWGVMTNICMGGVLLTWIFAPPNDQATFGRSGLPAILTFSLSAIAIATMAVIFRWHKTAALRWSVTCLCVAAAGAVLYLTFVSLFVTYNPAWVLLIFAGAGMAVVVRHLLRPVGQQLNERSRDERITR